LKFVGKRVEEGKGRDSGPVEFSETDVAVGVEIFEARSEILQLSEM
jgi:hypothetical protein